MLSVNIGKYCNYCKYFRLHGKIIQSVSNLNIPFNMTFHCIRKVYIYLENLVKHIKNSIFFKGRGVR